MISGWLPENLITGGNPFDGPLPVEYSGRYTEGGTGEMIGSTELSFKRLGVIFEASFIRERFGYGTDPNSSEFVRVLSIDLVQDGVFGVLLLDNFEPPAIAAEFFEFDAYTQLACVGGEEASVPLYGPCKTGEPVEALELVGSAPMYTEES